MKSLIIVSTLFSLLICSPLAAIEDKITPGQSIGKMIKEQGVVHLKRYGVRFYDENGVTQPKGLVGGSDRLPNKIWY